MDAESAYSLRKTDARDVWNQEAGTQNAVSLSQPISSRNLERDEASTVEIPKEICGITCAAQPC